MNKPNFFIVGAAKSGTTLLYYLLKQHPEIFLSDIKEPAFLAFYDKKFLLDNKNFHKWQMSFNSFDEYHNLFSNVSNEKIIGEASTVYLYDKDTAAKIKTHYPKAKILIILRNPVLRAFSSYQHVVRDGEEKQSFLNALKKEKYYIENNYALRWRYIDGGMYYSQVKRYFDIFGKNSVKVIIFEEFVKNKKYYLKDICKFLNINDFDFNLEKQVNTSGVFTNPVIKFIYTKLKNPPKGFGRLVNLFFSNKQKDNLLFYLENNYLKKLKLTDKEKNYLKNIFHNDILNLEKLLDKDLSFWRNI